MSKTILIVDDEKELLDVIKSVLETEGYAVYACTSAPEAQRKIEAMPFDLIISDYRMPVMNGLALLEWVKSTKPTPFILTTGFSEIMSTSSAHNLGLEGFLSKPYSIESLRELLSEVFSKETAPTENIDLIYNKISIDNFLADCEIPYRLYVRIKNDKFIKIAHAGELLDGVRILEYKNDGEKYLYLKKEDFEKFMRFHLSMARSLMISEEVSKERKENYIKNLSRTLYEKVFSDGVDEELFELSKSMIELSVGNIADRGEAAEIVSALKSLFRKKNVKTG